GTFTLTGSLNTARYLPTATLLNNGLVLIAGGYNNGTGSVTSAELYNPATGTFTLTGSLNTARYVHAATLLNNGMVLIAGGTDSSGNALASAELYEQGTQTPANLVSIAVSPATPTVPLDTAQRLIAIGTFSDSSTQTLESVTWSSSNNAVATITDDASNLGAAYAVASGTATINACAGSLCGSTLLTVGAPALVSIAVSPENGITPPGSTVQFRATGTYSDGSRQDLTS